MNKLFRKYIDGDIEKIDLHPVFRDDIGCKERSRECINIPWCITYTVLGPRGEPIAVVGGVYIYRSVMEIWAIVDKSVEKIPKHYAKAMRFLVNFEFERLKVQRMQISIRADAPWAAHWTHFLGFTIEGIMRKFGEENVDHYMVAKVRG